MAITLTKKAAQRMSDYLANRGSGVGVRLSVQTTGCSGLGYNMEFVDAVNDDDTEFDDYRAWRQRVVAKCGAAAHESILNGSNCPGPRLSFRP